MPVKRLGCLVLAPLARATRFVSQESLRGVPQWLFNDCRMLPGIGISLMGRLPTVGAVLEHQIESATRETLVSIFRAVGVAPAFAPDSGRGKLFGQSAD
jgi:hypothetical protein